MTGTAGPRLLIYSQDGLGLGHLRRTGSLVAEVLRVRPDVCALTVSDSPLGRFFAAVPNHDYLKLPSIRKLGPGRWRAHSMSMAFEDVLALRAQVIRSAATAFRPDVLLVDHMPHGAMGELLPTLELLRGTRARVVLGLRDILDSPVVIRGRWAVEGAQDAVRAYYHRVLVYGSAEVFDQVREYAWPPDTAPLVRYCGYVCPPQIEGHRQRIRARHLPSGRGRLVVGMVGGGADGYPLLSGFVDAVRELASTEGRVGRCMGLMVTGPFMPSAEVHDLETRASGLPLRVYRSVPDALSYIEAADVVVSMAGYNTTVEILSRGKPAVLVPRAGPSAEQRIRARLFAARGWALTVDPERLSGASLAGAIRTALRRSGLPPSAADMDGRLVATRELVALLDQARQGTAGAGPRLAVVEPSAAAAASG